MALEVSIGEFLAASRTAICSASGVLYITVSLKLRASKPTHTRRTDANNVIAILQRGSHLVNAIHLFDPGKSKQVFRVLIAEQLGKPIVVKVRRIAIPPERITQRACEKAGLLAVF
jgi:hypothetical protein